MPPPEQVETTDAAELVVNLRGLLAEATARPWVAFHEGKTRAIMKGKRPRMYSTAQHERWKEIIAWPGFDASDVPERYRSANLHLIVAAVNALPDILDRLETLTAKLSASEAEVETAFKDGFVCGFDHRARTDDPREAVEGAKRDWSSRALIRAALARQEPEGSSK